MLRRDFLYGLGASLGSVAFTSQVAADSAAGTAADKHASDGEPPLRTQEPHFPGAKAKNCIFLYMEGGPSHIDTFDPKPELSRLHMKEFVRKGNDQSAMSQGERYFVESPFKFRKAGQSGADMNTLWEHLAGVADDLCFYRGLQVDSINHPTANFQLNTGNRFGGEPALGAWVNYGLGSDNEDLPGFIVLPEHSVPQGGAANWSNGFLPASYQGTGLRPAGSPILDLAPPAGVTRDHQRRNLDFLQSLNRRHAEHHPEHGDLAARMANYELAFRMQVQVPEVLSIDGETQATLDNYGVGQEPTNSFGRRCLLARKLVEKGVRFVQVYASTWDSHDYIAKAHGQLIPTVDRPIAALITDLKERGLLDETLVVWMGEFGRSPDNGFRRGGKAYGRDHNSKAMAVWMAGGGVNAGHTIGATDETGAEAVENVHHVRDLHVTLLRLMGLDDNKLTYFHAGRYKQLSQFGGQVIEDLIA